MINSCNQDFLRIECWHCSWKVCLQEIMPYNVFVPCFLVHLFMDHGITWTPYFQTLLESLKFQKRFQLHFLQIYWQFKSKTEMFMAKSNFKSQLCNFAELISFFRYVQMILLTSFFQCSMIYTKGLNDSTKFHEIKDLLFTLVTFH